MGLDDAVWERSVFSAMGTNYTPGLGMSAFQTYWMRYRVFVNTGEVIELDDEYGDYSYNLSQLIQKSVGIEYLDLSIKRIDKNRYEVTDTVSNKSETISSLDELETFIINLGRGFIDYFKLCVELEEYKINIDNLVENFKLGLEENLRRKANIIWQNRDEHDY